MRTHVVGDRCRRFFLEADSDHLVDTVRPMTSELLDRFRAEATARGIPAEDVERWLATAARPSTMLRPGGDGPVVGEFGGPLLLPADTEDPALPHVASIDLAALPADATDLPLPPDGRLLFFAYPETDYEGTGGVVHVPAGTAVVERDRRAWNDFEWPDADAMFEAFPQGPLQATTAVSLPCHESVELPGEHPRAEELVEVWESVRPGPGVAGTLQLGGYADEEAIDHDPVASAVPRAVEAVRAESDEPVGETAADWVLLADWHAGWDVEGWESATVHWVIPRADLAARRFDRAYTSIFYNP